MTFDFLRHINTLTWAQSVGLVWGSAATWHFNNFVRWTKWTLTVTFLMMTTLQRFFRVFVIMVMMMIIIVI